MLVYQRYGATSRCCIKMFRHLRFLLLKKVSYVKSIDIWMITCDVFVFATILEYCIAQLLDRLDRDWKVENTISKYPRASTPGSSDSYETMMATLSGPEANRKCASRLEHYILSCKNHHWMDQLSRRVFPADKERLMARFS